MRNKDGFFDVPDVVPSLYAAPSIGAVEAAMVCVEAGQRQFHMDVMDGHFVPATGLSLHDIKSVAQAIPEALLHVHLMARDGFHQLSAIAKAGAATITVHPEAEFNPGETLLEIRRLGLGAGVAVAPGCDLESVVELRDLIDSVLVLLVYPGQPEQNIIPAMFEKVRCTRTLFPDTVVVADGCLDERSIPYALTCGTDLLVCGRSVFADPPSKTLPRLRNLLSQRREE